MKTEKIFNTKEFFESNSYSNFVKILRNGSISFLTLANLNIGYFDVFNSFRFGSNSEVNSVISSLIINSPLFPNLMRPAHSYLDSERKFSTNNILVIDIGSSAVNAFLIRNLKNEIIHYHIPNTMNLPLSYRFVNLAKFNEEILLKFVNGLNEMNISIVDYNFRNRIAEIFINRGFEDFIKPLFSIATNTIKKLVDLVKKLFTKYSSLKIYFATPFVYKISTGYENIEQLYYSIIGATISRVFENAFFHQFKLVISDDLENLIIIPDIPYYYYGLTTFVKKSKKIENIEIYELYNGMYYKIIVNYSDGEMKEYLLDRNQIEILKLGFSKAVAKRIEDRLELIDDFVIL